MKLRVQAQHLQPGDIVGSGEKVLSCGVSIRTPKGKIAVLLDKDGSARSGYWGKYTIINVEREEAK